MLQRLFWQNWAQLTKKIASTWRAFDRTRHDSHDHWKIMYIPFLCRGCSPLRTTAETKVLLQLAAAKLRRVFKEKNNAAESNGPKILKYALT